MASEVDRLHAAQPRYPTCPVCQAKMRRLARNGFFQRIILPWLGYYPWECPRCRKLKYFRNRGTKRRQG